MSLQVSSRFGAANMHVLLLASLAALGTSAAGAQNLDAWGDLRPGYAGARQSTLQSDRRNNQRLLDGTPRRTPNTDYDQMPPPIWNGVYLGFHAGYSIAEMSAARFDKLEFSGGAFGGHLGHNWQLNNVVIGVEADWSWHDNGGSREFPGYAQIRSNIDQAASLRLRLGFMADNILFYLTGGGAAASANTALNLGPYQTRQHEMLYGYAAGAGIDVKLTHNTSGRVEAIYYGFDDKTFHFNSGWMAIDTGILTVRAGLTYQFN